jgi:hypothetical protein
MLASQTSWFLGALPEYYLMRTNSIAAVRRSGHKGTKGRRSKVIGRQADRQQKGKGMREGRRKSGRKKGHKANTNVEGCGWTATIHSNRNSGAIARAGIKLHRKV